MPDIKFLVAFAVDDFVLQFSAHGGKVGIIAGNAHQEMPIVLRMILRVFEHVGIKHVDLQSRAAVLGVALQKRLEFILVHRVSQNRRIEGDGVTGSVGQLLSNLPSRLCYPALPPSTLPTELALAVGPLISAPLEGHMALDRNCPLALPSALAAMTYPSPAQ